MKFLVTGAGGFIGSHVVEILASDASNRVSALLKYGSGRELGNLKHLPSTALDQIDLHWGDISDSHLTSTLVHSIKPDVIINLAALVGIPYSYEATGSYVQVNVLGTINLLNAIKDTPIKFLQLSTSEVYGNPEVTPITLKHALNPQSPYAASKVAADSYVKAYVASFGTEAAIIRPFNTFGPRQSTRALIPTLINQILGSQLKVELGSLTPRRDFTYVVDTAAAIVLASKSQLSNGNIIQLGTGLAFSVEEVFKLICKLEDCYKTIEIVSNRVRPRNSEIELLLSDPSSAKEILGWTAKTAFEEGLSKTLDWYKRQKEKNSLVPY